MSNEQYLDDKQFMDLPPLQQPAGEQTPGAPGQAPEIVKQQGSERNPELLSTQQGGQGATNQQATQQLPPVDPALAQGQGASISVVPHSMPQMADDTDLIEKEWVEKAQDIIRRTKDDPHNQSKELGQVKAQYLKKRFDKNLNTGKDKAK